VVSPLVSKNQPVVKPGKKAQKAEDEKIKKHLVACHEAGYGFKPFSIDIFGLMGKETTTLFTRLINSIARCNGFDLWKATAIAQRKICIAVQIGVAKQLLAARQPSPSDSYAYLN